MLDLEIKKIKQANKQKLKSWFVENGVARYNKAASKGYLKEDCEKTAFFLINSLSLDSNLALIFIPVLFSIVSIYITIPLNCFAFTAFGVFYSVLVLVAILKITESIEAARKELEKILKK